MIKCYSLQIKTPMLSKMLGIKKRQCSKMTEERNEAPTEIKIIKDIIKEEIITIKKIR